MYAGKQKEIAAEHDHVSVSLELHRHSHIWASCSYQPEQVYGFLKTWKTF